MTSRLLAALLPILVAGCAVPSWVPGFGDDDAGPAVPISASTSTSLPEAGPLIDGIYRGTGELVSGSADTCPTDSWGNLEVGDRAMLYAYTPATIFSTPITPDGKIHAAAGNYVLDGTMSGREIDFTVQGPDCKTAFSFARASGF